MDLNFINPIYVSIFVIGFLGSGHCVGMCGGIASALSFAISDSSAARRAVILLSYNLGRILSYGIMGALAGWLGLQFGGSSILRWLAGFLLITMGLYLAGWWRGLAYLEKGGSFIWRFIQPLGKNLIPLKTIPKAVLLGLLWGWLPCGMVYSALAYAAAQGDSLTGAAVMVSFGLGTLPAVFLSGWAASGLKVFLQRQIVRSFFAVLIILFGCWTLWAPLSSILGQNSHAHHASNDRSSTAEQQHPHHSH